MSGGGGREEEEEEEEEEARRVSRQHATRQLTRITYYF